MNLPKEYELILRREEQERMKTKLTTILLLTAKNGEEIREISVPVHHDSATEVDALIKDTKKWQETLDDHVLGWEVVEVRRKPLIFVFGSNLAGVHGAGAAKYALENRGAVWGHGLGLQGDSYAIPTKDYEIRSLDLNSVQSYIKYFLSFASDYPEYHFQVTRVGCGLAGFKDEQIAPMFKRAPHNCLFDTAWQQWLQGKDFWGTF